MKQTAMLQGGQRMVWVSAKWPGFARIHRVWCRLAHNSGSDDSAPWIKELNNTRSSTTVKSNEKFTPNSVASVMDIFLSSNEDLMERLSRALGGKLDSTPRVSLRSRLETLEGVGCTLSQIQAYPEILRLRETEVIKRAQRLRSLGAPISVELLKAASIKSAAKLEERVVEIQNCDSFLCQALLCTPGELAKLKQQLPVLETMTRRQTITEKLNTLAQLGVSLADVKALPNILTRSSKMLTKRLKKLKQMKESGDLETFPMYWLILSEKNFTATLQNHREIKARNVKVQTQLEAMLGLPGEEVSALNGNLKLLSPAQVRKVKFLLEVGIPKEEIVNHIYLLNSSLARLQEAVEQAQGAGVDPPSAIFLISIIHHRRIPHRPSPPRQMAFLAEILDTDVSSLHSLGLALQQLGFVDKVTLRRNLAFFRSKGFSVEDVRACPLVLMHPSDRLANYFDRVPQMPEFQPFEEVACNNVMFLNILQYVIERDMNFGCNVLHAEVEEEESTGDAKVTES